MPDENIVIETPATYEGYHKIMKTYFTCRDVNKDYVEITAKDGKKATISKPRFAKDFLTKDQVQPPTQ